MRDQVTLTHLDGSDFYNGSEINQMLDDLNEAEARVPLPLFIRFKRYMREPITTGFFACAVAFLCLGTLALIIILQG